MKEFLFASVMVLMAVASAQASDFVYTETETETVWESVNVNTTCGNGCEKRFLSSRDVEKPSVRPCAARQVATQPVRVKTHTEVIDHYQVYQPVTVYKPMGTQIQRRVVPAKTCNKCGF